MDTDRRIDYLRKIINREIPLKPGQMKWLSDPCSIISNVGQNGGKFGLLGQGASGKVFNVCIDELCDYEFVLKEVKYLDEKDYLFYDNQYRFENVEVRIFKLLNDLVYIGATPHIPLYLGDFTCDIKGEHYRYTMIEKANTNLLSLIKNKKTDDNFYRNVLFQLLYTLKVIQKRYPDFIHNDLKADNILVFNTDQTTTRYILDDQVYYLKTDFKIALWDFGLSSMICEGCDNIHVEDILAYNQLGIQTEKNHYKDIFKFIYYLNRFVTGLTKTFVNKYLYKGDVDDYDNLIPNIEPYTIEQMLNDPYFDPLRVSVDKINQTYSDKNITNMELSRFSGISDISYDLVFDCKPYTQNQVMYFTSKIPSLNDPYRTNCLSTESYSDSELLSSNDSDFYNLLDGTAVSGKDQYRSEVIDLGLRHIEDFYKLDNDTKNSIVEMYTYLFTKFVDMMNVNAIDRIISNVLRAVILNKAVFIVSKKHHPVKLVKMGKYLDYTIQFNEFLCVLNQ